MKNRKNETKTQKEKQNLTLAEVSFYFSTEMTTGVRSSMYYKIDETKNTCRFRGKIEFLFHGINTKKEYVYEWRSHDCHY